MQKEPTRKEEIMQLKQDCVKRLRIIKRALRLGKYDCALSNADILEYDYERIRVLESEENK